MTLFADNLAAIRRRMEAAAGAAGRDPAGVSLIAVSKGQPREAVEAALAAGQRRFGENRVQEAKAKFAPLRETRSGLVLHLIGSLQTNKAEEAVRLFDVIETLDRPHLADALVKAIRKTGRTPRLFIEINLGAEPQKAGIAPDSLAEFLVYCRKAELNVTGLMAIPPQNTGPEPFFRQLKSLADAHSLPHISMGMSDDFEAAIGRGATEVRVGTALFGVRMPEAGAGA